ncbi:MAG: energy transducer TonB [Desulfobacterales bacterium]|nr:energy transducer TonB [Desulfobacterales bacterium]
MNAQFSKRQALLTGEDEQTRRFATMFVVSALAHFFLLGMLYVMPSPFDRSFRAGPRAINVDLVSLPAPGPPQPTAAPPAPPPPKPKPEAAKPEPVPPPPPKVKKAPVSVAPQKKKPKVVKSLKKKTAPKKTAAAVTRPTPKPAPKKAPPPRTNQVTSAIEAMRKKVAGQEQARQAAGAGGAGSGAGIMDRLQNYKLDVGYSVGQNFAFPQQLARSSQDMATLITFRVLPNGEIVDVKIYKSSGNSQLDEAAYRAVLKSNPVKPHPEGLTRPYIEVGLRCTPTGVQ